MEKEKWSLNGYAFSTKEDFEKAKKEAESIMYIKAHVNMQNSQQVLKLYNKAVDTKMFHTVIGYEFLHQLYTYLIKNKVIEVEYIKNIPVRKQIVDTEVPEDLEAANKKAEQFRLLYEDAVEKRKQRNIIIGFLVFLICLMIAMVYFNYKSYDENQILDKYSAWEAELEEREQEIEKKEERLGIDTTVK